LRERNILDKVRIQALSREAEAVGIGNATVAKARGEAEAIETITEKLKENPDYLRWQAINTWNGELPLSTGSAFPFIDISLLNPDRLNSTDGNSTDGN
jgi:regulator of protease activity HflC (stomatin/prohibitin superfamily)